MAVKESELETVLKKYNPGKREDLIPILQDIQDSTGYISEEAIVKVGEKLGLSTTKIFGLATFYDQFRFVPAGKIHFKVCNGTSCFLNGSESGVNKLSELLGIEPGQTTRDGNFSLETVTCMGGCTNGPVICINGEYHTRILPDKIPELVSRLKYLNEIN